MSSAPRRSMGRNCSGSIARRSGSCHSSSLESGAASAPTRMRRRFSTASSMVGYMDSNTTASGRGQPRHRTREAAPSETPITPRRASGWRRRSHSRLDRTASDSFRPKVIAGAGLAPCPGRSISSTAWPCLFRKRARASIWRRSERMPCSSSRALLPRPSRNQPATGMSVSVLMVTAVVPGSAGKGAAPCWARINSLPTCQTRTAPTTAPAASAFIHSGTANFLTDKSISLLSIC